MLPLDRNRSATPAIWSLKITTRCHSVRSLRSPDALSVHWSDVARLKLTILPPFCVSRTSGSFPSRPIRITLFTLPAIVAFLLSPSKGGPAQAAPTHFSPSPVHLSQKVCGLNPAPGLFRVL